MSTQSEQFRLKLNHAGVSKDIALHEGITVSDLHTLIRAAFPSAGIIAGIEDESHSVYPLTAVCLKISAFAGLGSYTVAVALPHTELMFAHEDQTQKVIVHFDADPADVSSLLHTIFNVTPGSLIVGVSDGSVVLPISSLCDNPPLYQNKRLSLVLKEPVAKRSDNLMDVKPPPRRGVRFNGTQGPTPVQLPGDVTGSNSTSSPATPTSTVTTPTLPSSVITLERKGSAQMNVIGTLAARNDPSPSLSERYSSADSTSSKTSDAAIGMVVSGSKIDKVKRKVKVYKLNGAGEWDDLGTGIAVCGSSKSGGAAVLVMKDDNSVLIKMPITVSTNFQREQPTLVVWDDTAISFQDSQGCDEVWQQITRLQGKQT